MLKPFVKPDPLVPKAFVSLPKPLVAPKAFVSKRLVPPGILVPKRFAPVPLVAGRFVTPKVPLEITGCCAAPPPTCGRCAADAAHPHPTASDKTNNFLFMPFLKHPRYPKQFCGSQDDAHVAGVFTSNTFHSDTA